MTKNFEVKKRPIASIDKKSEGMKRGFFDTPISCERAVLRICIPSAHLKSLNFPERITLALKEAIKGLPARLINDRELPDNLKKSLQETTARLGSLIQELGLTTDKKMYGILWLRLLRQADCKVEHTVYQRLGEWRLQREAEGALAFRDTSDETERLKAHSRGNKLTAYAVEELLLGSPIKPSRLWPYNKKWQLHIEPRNAPTISNAPAARTEESELAKKRKARPKRKTLEDYKRVCGTGVVEHLQEALRNESASGRDFVLAASRDRFTTELSASELLIKLKRYQPGKLTGSDSTLRKAFAAFLTIPRGRPPKKRPARKQR